jgi:hypothetical protein
MVRTPSKLKGVTPRSLAAGAINHYLHGNLIAIQNAAIVQIQDIPPRLWY